MKSLSKFAAALAALAATSAFATPQITQIPEPGSLALVGLAVGVLVAVSRKGK